MAAPIPFMVFGSVLSCALHLDFVNTTYVLYTLVKKMFHLPKHASLLFFFHCHLQSVHMYSGTWFIATREYKPLPLFVVCEFADGYM